MGKKDRDNKGRFSKGNQLAKGKGRPKSSGRKDVQDMAWEHVNRLAEMMFKWPEAKLLAYLKTNGHKLTRAEKVYLDASKDVKTLEALLDRIIPKTMAIDATLTNKDPIIENLYNLPAGGVSQEIERLLEAREIIDAEYKSLEPPKKED